jgi:tetratricopeptide (TPR) repeat protein
VRIPLLFLAALATSSWMDSSRAAEQAARPVSLIGTELRDPDWSPATRAALEKDLLIARKVMEIAPEREDSWIWLGRRLAYLNRFDEAIEVFTAGLEKFPDSYKLLRFRARKLARSRQFERAIADYRRGAALMEGIEDSYEPDGILNARNQFLGSYRGNMHYYLGQTLWAVGDYAGTLRGMERSIGEPLVQNPDHVVATTYWRYLALRKLGRSKEAAELVRKLPPDLKLLENEAYYDGARFMQGSLDRQTLMARGDAIRLFAVAMDHHFRGEQGEAERLWIDIITNTPQGFWPAETELLAARARRSAK